MSPPRAAAPKPDRRPANPCFSSGPCAKRPGFTLAALAGALLGRSHRAAAPKARLAAVIDRSRAILGMPDEWRLGIVPASDTGAVEMALWSLLGARPVDVLSFGELRRGLGHRHRPAPEAGRTRACCRPRMARCRTCRRSIRRMTWCSPGTARPPACGVPHADWIAADRQGLAICDATSAAFAMELPWDKLDVVTWSWQKVLGGEAAHGMLALSPRAVERLESYTPPWPLPKLFRLTSKGKLSEGIFDGDTINTPSMLCVEDALDGLRLGGADRRPCRR